MTYIEIVDLIDLMAKIRSEALRKINEKAGFFMRSGIAYSVADAGDCSIVSCMGRKWRIKRDSCFEANMEKTMLKIEAMAGKLKSMKEIHKENAEILLSVMTEVCGDKSIAYDLTRSENGFVLSCKPVKLSVSFGKSANEGTLICVRSAKRTKTTSLAATALEFFVKAAEEACR